MRVSVVTAMLASVLLVGCSTTEISPRQYEHSLNVSWDGQPFALVQKSNGRAVEFDQQLDDIVAKITRTNPQSILIFIHGGMNTIEGGLQRAKDATAAMQQDDPTIYPIFVNWHSRFVTWYDRLLRIRQGRAKPVVAWFTWPFVLGADFGRSATRLPATMLGETARSLSNLTGIGRNIELGPTPLPAGNVRLDNHYKPSFRAKVGSLVLQVIPGALRPVTMLLADTVLYDSYRMMLRRIDMLFRTEADYAETSRSVQGAGSNGAVTKLTERLKNLPNNPSLTLVGHSLGCIAANEILRRNPLLKFDNIVFMAAGCSSKDFLDTIPGYLEKHKDSNFFALSLHPNADRNEKSGWGSLPNGSLLEWLDAYAIQVHSPLEKTFGKWNNAMETLPFLDKVKPEVQKRICLKGFAVRGKQFPAKHGDFDDFPFWRRSFWNPADQTVKPAFRTLDD
ncbi:MAG: hypothetical protein AAF581_22140 [Planctomycetota bacterium]